MMYPLSVDSMFTLIGWNGVFTQEYNGRGVTLNMYGIIFEKYFIKAVEDFFQAYKSS